jgi:cobalt-zinc-cadmium efflux system membrane fusion protein
MNIEKKLVFLVTLVAAAACSESKTPGDAETSSAQQGTTVVANISPQSAQMAGIELQTAGPARIRTTLSLYGSIKPNAEREQNVRARYPGIVRNVTKRIGDPIREGETLLTIESSDSLQEYPILAPLSGQVLTRDTNPGEAVDSSSVLMKVADLSTVWAEFSVFTRDLGRVRPGMPVVIHGLNRDEDAEAKLDYVAPAGDAGSQSVVARAVVDNRDRHWVAGQFIIGDIVTADVRVPVSVRPEALQEFGDKTVVFVPTESGFEPRPVRIGRRSREAVEIVGGIDAATRYAAKNSYLIKADLLKSAAEEN